MYDHSAWLEGEYIPNLRHAAVVRALDVLDEHIAGLQITLLTRNKEQKNKEQQRANCERCHMCMICLYTHVELLQGESTASSPNDPGCMSCWPTGSPTQTNTHVQHIPAVQIRHARTDVNQKCQHLDLQRQRDTTENAQAQAPPVSHSASHFTLG